MEHWIKEKYDQVKQKENRLDVSRSGGFNATAGGSSFYLNAVRSPSVLSELNLRARSRSMSRSQTPLRVRHSYSDSKLIVPASRSISPNYRDDPRAPSLDARLQ